METIGRDPLTGAYTREFLPQRLKEELASADRSGAPLSLILFDLDYFKSINDAFGHAVGDAVLQATVAKLHSLIRKNDLLFRYGGDEFLLLMPSTPAAQVRVLAERIARAFENAPLLTDPSISITLSGGAATYPEDGHTVEVLFQVADQRNHAAKQLGRARIVTLDVPANRTLQEPSRLIGRDQAVEVANRFLESVQLSGRGILQVQAGEGMGISEYMHHIARLAHLRGHLVLHISGNQALSYRAYGALLEIPVERLETQIADWPYLELPGAWQEALQSKQGTGWIILVENWKMLDSYTRTLLERLYTSAEFFAVGLAYHVPESVLGLKGFPWETGPRFETDLPPLTQPQVQIRMREVLSWDPPEGFTLWLCETLQGKPETLLHALKALLQAKILHFDGNSVWQLSPAYPAYDLVTRLRPKVAPIHLPPLTDGFLGRHKKVLQVKNALRQARLVTLEAIGGMGKTRLATQVAAEMAAEFPDGVFFIPLENVCEAHLIPQRIAETLTLSLPASLPVAEAVCQVLNQKQMLLVLDNFEQLAANDQFIPLFLRETSAPRLLVTSRTYLNLPEEQRITLEGLEVPAPGAEAMPQIFDSTASVRLFLRSVRQHDQAYQLTTTTRPQVAQLCQITAGMPLGLQMLASWMHLMPVDELLERLKSGLQLLVAGPYQNLPERQRSLVAIFETLWEILAPVERVMLMRLGVFPSTFTAWQAREIGEGSLFFLDGLVQRAVIWKRSDGRFQCHPLLRQYLNSRLMEYPAEAQLTRQRFVAHFSARCAQIVAYWEAPQTGPDRLVVSQEVDNLRQAWEWCLQQRAYDALLPMLNVLHYYYQHYGWLREGQALFTALRQQLLSQPTDEATFRIMGYANLAVARYAYHLGKYTEGLPLAEQALALFEAHGQALGIFHAIDSLAMLTRALGNTAHSEDLLDRAQLLARELNLPGLLYDVYNNRALIAYQEVRLEEAETFFKKGLVLCEELHNAARIAAGLNNLGNVAYERSDYPGARAYLEEALQRAESLEGQTLLAAVLDSLGKVCTAQGDYEYGHACLLRGLRICQQVGAIPLGLELLTNMGILLASQGKTEEARRLWHSVVTDERAVHNVRQMVWRALGTYRVDLPEDGYQHEDFDVLLAWLTATSISAST